VITIPDHQVLSKIYESANTLVYRGRRNVDGLPVIFKILKEDFPTTPLLAFSCLGSLLVEW